MGAAQRGGCSGARWVPFEKVAARPPWRPWNLEGLLGGESFLGDPLGPAEGIDRVLRGGSFYGLALNVRSAYRGYTGPAVRLNSIGFRVARTYP